MRIWLLQSKSGRYRLPNYDYISSPTLAALCRGYYHTRAEARQVKLKSERPVAFAIEVKRLTLRR